MRTEHGRLWWTQFFLNSLSAWRDEPLGMKMGENQNCALVSVVGSTNEWRPCRRVTFENSSMRRTIIQVHMWFKNDLKDRRAGLWLSLSNFSHRAAALLCGDALWSVAALRKRRNLGNTASREPRSSCRQAVQHMASHRHKSRHNMKKQHKKEVWQP